jgi:hypothetical protein
MKCWVIVAGQGEYSDRLTWPFRVYLNKEDAQAMMAKLDVIEKSSHRDYSAALQAYRDLGINDGDDFSFTGDTDWELCEAEFVS